jgi:hypothetical protein
MLNPWSSSNGENSGDAFDEVRPESGGQRAGSGAARTAARNG